MSLLCSGCNRTSISVLRVFYHVVSSETNAIKMMSLCFLKQERSERKLTGLCREQKFIVAMNCLGRFFDPSRTKLFVS